MRYFTIPGHGFTDKTRTNLCANRFGLLPGFFDLKMSGATDPVDPGDSARRGGQRPRAGMSTDIAIGKARGPNPL
jgi:hypothetical protein